MYSSAVENLAVPVYDLVRKTSRYKCRRILERTQWLTKEEIKQLQVKNLRHLLEYAYRNVPYYHRIFNERGLKPQDISTTKDLNKLPVLTKEIIRRNFNDLISRDFPRSKMIPYSTGGTGSPLGFFISKEKQSWEVAAEYRAYRWAGYRYGDRCFMFWGARRDYEAPSFSFSHYAKRFAGLLQRTVVVDPFILSDKSLNGFAKSLRKFKPDVIRGYAMPVYITARYLLENKIHDIQAKTVITSAETLFNPMRKTIEDGFGCAVFDHYGSREIGAIASECEKHRGYHISAENVVVEVIRKGEKAKGGETGVLLLTGLRNYAMPLIRYKIGDVGEPSEKTCACGRGLPLMNSIKGYESQFLAAIDRNSGKIIPVSSHIDYFLDLLKSPPPSYRIIQESLHHITIKMVKGKRFYKEDVDVLKRELKAILGSDVEIEVQFVKVLPPLPSGKRSPVISKVDPFENSVARAS